MKALILTMTSGDGHNVISRSISKRLDAHSIENKIVDIYRSKKFSHWFNSVGYIIANKYFRPIYAKIYKSTKFRPTEKKWKGGVNSYLKSIKADILNEINEYKPDFVLAPHPYTAALVSIFVREKTVDENIRMYGILTDLFPHAFWETAINCDKIYVPSLCCEEEMNQKGIPSEKLMEIGFPVNDRFFDRTTKENARNLLGIQDKFTVMLSSGGFGTANNHKIVKKLLKSGLPIQILNLNSRNKRGKKRVDKLIRRFKATNVYNYGYVDDVGILMQSSDVIICKGGCSTLFEAMVTGLPMIIRECVINNEVENTDYLQKQEICIRMKKTSDAPKIVEYLYNNPDKLAKMSQNCIDFAKPDCIEKLIEDILKDFSL